MTWEDRRRPAVRGQRTGFQTAVQGPRPEGASRTSLGLLGVHPASSLTWSGVSVLVDSSFRAGGRVCFLQRQLRDVSDFSPYLSGNWRFGDSVWFLISAVAGSGPSSPALFLHLHVPQSFPVQPLSEAWAGLGDHSCPTSKRQTEDRAGGCPGRAHRVLLGSSPAFPLVILNPGGTGVEQEGDNVLDGGVNRKLGRGMQFGNSVLEVHRDSELECTISRTYFINIKKTSCRATWRN